MIRYHWRDSPLLLRLELWADNSYANTPHSKVAGWISHEMLEAAVIDPRPMLVNRLAQIHGEYQMEEV